VSETEPKRIFVGHLPSGTVAFVAEGEADPITILLRDADRKIAAERAEDERQRQALADTETSRAGGWLSFLWRKR
jgi:hypothetical protein